GRFLQARILGNLEYGVHTARQLEPHAGKEQRAMTRSSPSSSQSAADTRDVTDRTQIDIALRAIVEGTAAVTGDDFFRSLVKYLATALQTRYAFVAECTDPPPKQAHILAFWEGASFGPDRTYDLAGTPCESVVAGQSCLYAQDIQAFFPQNQALARMELQSYLGVPLFDATGKVLGHLVVMD